MAVTVAWDAVCEQSGINIDPIQESDSWYLRRRKQIIMMHFSDYKTEQKGIKEYLSSERLARKALGKIRSDKYDRMQLSLPKKVPQWFFRN